MSKVAVVFWSGTGNTQAMADSVAEGARAAGAEVFVFGPSEFGKAFSSRCYSTVFSPPNSSSRVFATSSRR